MDPDSTDPAQAPWAWMWDMKLTQAEIYPLLVESLRVSAAVFSERTDKAEKLAVAAQALFAIIRFFDADEMIMKEQLTTPLLELATAASERAAGQSPALLRIDKTRVKRGRQSWDLFRAAIMVAIDLLLIGRNLSESEAARFVATELTRQGRPATEAELRGWRKNWASASDVAKDFREQLKSRHPAFHNLPSDPNEAKHLAAAIVRCAITTGGSAILNSPPLS
jgi:hypothetical protein